MLAYCLSELADITVFITVQPHMALSVHTITTGGLTLRSKHIICLGLYPTAPSCRVVSTQSKLSKSRFLDPKAALTFPVTSSSSAV